MLREYNGIDSKMKQKNIYFKNFIKITILTARTTTKETYVIPVLSFAKMIC